jgi:probable poly-beta-1,6-N-acetyl-D-glucosamine export protein
MQRYEYIDILRAIGIFAVLLIHISANFIYLPFGTVKTIYVGIDVMSQIGVPLFIYISGFVLTKKYYTALSLSAYYKKRFIKILPMYLICSIFYILFNHAWNWPNITAVGFVKALIFGESAYHLWFMFLLFQFYLLFPVFLVFIKRIPNKILFVSLFVLQTVWWGYSMQTADFPMLYRDFFISHIFYFFLGMFMARKDYAAITGKLKNMAAILSMLIVTGVISAYWLDGMRIYHSFYSIPKEFLMIPNGLSVLLYSSVILYLWLQRKYFLSLMSKSGKIMKCLLLIGQDAYEIYLVHLFFLLNIIQFVSHYNFTSVWYVPVAFTTTLALSLGLVEILKHIDYLLKTLYMNLIGTAKNLMKKR